MGDDFLTSLVLFGLLVVIGVPVLAIMALVKVAAANRRIAALEARVADLAQDLSTRPSRPDLSAAVPEAGTPVLWSPSAIPATGRGLGERAADPPRLRPEIPAEAETESEPKFGQPSSSDAPASMPSYTAGPAAPPPILRLGRWISVNWVYVVSALSLALAGVFFVQYGIEAGLLPPPLRVLAGVLFGGALIAASEWLRRRHGADEVAGATIYLPSVFGGAGLVAIFAALTAGRLMYGLYGPGLAFVGLFLTALSAVWLGWRNGPFLAAIGLLGASAAPFLVAGGGGAAPWLYGYYLMILAIGLGVDAWRLWGWISILAMVLSQLGLFAMREGGAGPEAWIAAQLGFVLLSILLPGRSLTPRHDGTPLSMALLQRELPRPNRPVLLAGGAVIAASVQILSVMTHGATAGLIPYMALTLLVLILLWWTSEAEALADLAYVPAVAFLIRLGLDTRLQWAWLEQIPALRPPETTPPAWASWLLLMATLMSAAAALRALRGGGLLPALAAVIIAPVAAVILEALWTPASVIGAYPWALHVIALAAAMVWLAIRFARQDAGAGRRFAWAALSALSLIALALFILTTAAALTLALAVLLALAAALDRRFDLPEMSWFIQAGAAVISYRLVVDPGLVWGETAPLSALLLAHLSVAFGAAIAWRLIAGAQGRGLARAVLESLGGLALALLVTTLLLRNLVGAPDAQGIWSTDYLASHWGATAVALPWLLLAMSQLWRARATEGWGRRLRLIVAGLAGALAAAGLLLAVSVFNPLWWGNEASARVLGPPLLDSLALAYAVPGLLMLLFGLRFATGLPSWARGLLAGAGGVLVTLYVVTEIRRLWHGPDIGGSFVLQGELYSYTLALLLTGAVLLWQALARRSVLLKRIAMAVIAATVAKVFLWDVSGLSGLVRVISFAGLGLSLAGLAWLNRWAGQTMAERDKE